MEDGLLPGLPVELIRRCYAAAPGNEIDGGKFASPESSAALVANAFGLFLDRPSDLPPFPDDDAPDWPPLAVQLEAEVRFPWNGGRHPWLDVLIETSDRLIGVESKRYEPFRAKGRTSLSDAYWRPVWGEEMEGYFRVRDGLRDGSVTFAHLDAGQLVKHAFGLRTAVHRHDGSHGKHPVLMYLYAEPTSWPNGRVLSAEVLAAHRAEVCRFARMVDGAEVEFRACSYGQVFAEWQASHSPLLHRHATSLQARFGLAASYRQNSKLRPPSNSGDSALSD